MSMEIANKKSQMEKLSRCLLLFVIVSSFFDPGMIYITESNPHGYTDVVFYKNISSLWKMVILLLVATAFLSYCHSKMPWLIVTPFIPFLIWLIVSAAYNGITLRMVLSFATLLTPILFVGAFGTLFRFPQDIYLLKRTCLCSIFIAFIYSFFYRIFISTAYYDVMHGTTPLTYIYFGNRLPLCACSIVAGVITAVELKKDIYNRKKMILLSFLFLIPILSGGRIYLVGGVLAYVWLFLKIFRRNAIKCLAFLIPILILGSLLMWRFYFEKTFGDSSVQISEIRASGRWEAWPEYWEFAMKEPFFGHGPGADFAYRQEYDLEIAGVSHNDYLGLLTYGGWPALLLFLFAMFWWFAIVRHASARDRKYSDLHFASLMPVVFFFIVAIAGNPLRKLSVMCVLLAPVSMAIGHLSRQKVTFKHISQTTGRRLR